MKKENYILENQVVKGVNSLINRFKGLENQDFFLCITNLDTLNIEATNLKGRSFFKKVLEEDEIFENSIFNKIIHPEDHTHFFNMLGSCHSLRPEQGKDFRARVKVSEGTWKNYLFSNRIYTGFPQQEEKYAISILLPVESSERTLGEHGISRVESQNHLLESRNKYKTLVNSLDDGYGVIEILFDPDKNAIDYLFVEVNPAFEQHVRLENPVGKTIKEFSPDHKPQWFQVFGNVALSGKSTRFQKLAEDLDETWLDVYAFPIGTRNQRQVAILCSDITRRKIAEENLGRLNTLLQKKVDKSTKELKANNKMLQMVFDSVNQGIFVLKPLFGSNGDIMDFIYVRVNATIARYYKQIEMVGSNFLELNPDAAKRGVFELFKQTMLTGERKDFELEIERNGKSSWYRVTSRRQQGLLINTLENITARRQKAQNLKESIRFKKQLVQTSPDIIFIFNLIEEKVKFMNRNLSSEPGMTRKDIVGMPLLDIIPLIHPEDRQRALEFHFKLLESTDRDIVDIEFRLKVRKNRWECHYARGKVFKRSQKGNPYEYLVFLRNVQDQKITQKALIHAEKLSIKGEMARTLAHELRNPLASIGVSADILEKKITENPIGLNNYVDIIKRSAKTLNQLVTDLLTSSNYSPAALKKCCLAETTDLALKEADDRIYLTGITVIKKYKKPKFIYADKGKLKIALLNIIVNASEAMTPHEGILSLDIRKKDDHYILSINDNGCGLEKEQMDRLFDSFYTRKPDGVGIGLNSVKNILQEHEASIEVKSTPKRGTTFYLSFDCYEKTEGS